MKKILVSIALFLSLIRCNANTVEQVTMALQELSEHSQVLREKLVDADSKAERLQDLMISLQHDPRMATNEQTIAFLTALGNNARKVAFVSLFPADVTGETIIDELKTLILEGSVNIRKETQVRNLRIAVNGLVENETTKKTSISIPLVINGQRYFMPIHTWIVMLTHLDNTRLDGHVESVEAALAMPDKAFLTTMAEVFRSFWKRNLDSYIGNDKKTVQHYCRGLANDFHTYDFDQLVAIGLQAHVLAKDFGRQFEKLLIDATNLILNNLVPYYQRNKGLPFNQGDQLFINHAQRLINKMWAMGAGIFKQEVLIAAQEALYALLGLRNSYDPSVKASQAAQEAIAEKRIREEQERRTAEQLRFQLIRRQQEAQERAENARRLRDALKALREQSHKALIRAQAASQAAQAVGRKHPLLHGSQTLVDAVQEQAHLATAANKQAHNRATEAEVTAALRQVETAADKAEELLASLPNDVRQEAALLVQRITRGYLARQKAARMHAEKQDHAVRTIQHRMRGHQERQRFVRTRKAAQTLQQKFRSRQAQKELVRRKKAAKTITKVGRGYVGRKQARLKRRHKAATTIQSATRRRRAQQKLKKRRRAADRIRSTARRKLARDKYTKEQAAIQTIQRVTRGGQTRKRLREEKKRTRMTFETFKKHVHERKQLRARLEKLEQKRQDHVLRAAFTRMQEQATHARTMEHLRLQAQKAFSRVSTATSSAQDLTEARRDITDLHKFATQIRELEIRATNDRRDVEQEEDIDAAQESLNTLEQLAEKAEALLQEAKELVHKTPKPLRHVETNAHKQAHAAKHNVVTALTLESREGRNRTILAAVKEAMEGILNILNKYDKNAGRVKRMGFFRKHGSKLLQHIGTLDQYRGETILSGEYVEKRTVKQDEEQAETYRATLAKAEDIISSFEDQSTLPEHILKVRKLFFIDE